MTYITPAEFKETLSLYGTSYADDDIIRALASASKAIDRFCGRTFGTAAAQTRFYRPETSTLVRVDDVQAVTEVAHDAQNNGTYSDVRAAGTYSLRPLNALADDVPFTSIRFVSGTVTNTVRVTGTFGWAETPPEVLDATVMIAAAILKRVREAPFGVATFGDETKSAMKIAALDTQVKGLLSPLVSGAQRAIVL